MYAAVGTTQETVFLLEGAGVEQPCRLLCCPCRHSIAQLSLTRVVLCCSGPMYAAVGTAQETVFPLAGAGELASLQRKAWASSYDSLPSSSALDDGLDPQPPHLDRCAPSITEPSCSHPHMHTKEHQDLRACRQEGDCDMTLSRICAA